MDSENSDRPRKSRRIRGEEPQFQPMVSERKLVIAGRNWTRHEMKSNFQNDKVSSSKSSHSDEYRPLSRESQPSLVSLSTKKSGKLSVRTTGSQKLAELEIRAKVLEAKQKAEQEFAEFQMRQKLEKIHLEAELELAKLEKEENRSQYLGSDLEDSETEYADDVSDWSRKLETEVKTAGAWILPMQQSGNRQTENLNNPWYLKDKPVNPAYHGEPSQENPKVKFSQTKNMPTSEPARKEMVPFSADQLSMLFQAQDLARVNSREEHATGGGEIRKFVARQSGVTALPDFYGDPEKWPMFISHYRGTTKACGYTDFDNVCRLRKSLKGKAMEAVQDMLNQEEKLPLVMQKLEEYFGQPDLIVKTVVARAKRVPAVKEEKPETVIDFANAVSNMVATMETLGKTGHMTNPTLLEELVEKLPTSFKTRWGEVILDKSTDVDLKDFSKWIEKRAKIANCLRCISTSDKTEKQREPKTDEKRKPKQDGKNPGAHKKDPVFAASECVDQKKASTAKCLFCSKNKHTTKDCRAFQKEDVESRWKWVTVNKVCFSCLQSGHNMTSCKEKIVCDQDGCKLFHNKLLHKEQQPKVIEEKVEPEMKPQVVGHSAVPRNIRSPVILQILPVTLQGPKGEETIYAVLDDCSSLTLIDMKLANRLGLNGHRKILRMTWTNGVTACEPKSKAVSVRIRGTNETESFEIDNVRTSSDLKLGTQSVNMEAMVRKWEHLKGVPVDSYSDVVPSMLIGQDKIHLIVPRELREGTPNAPMASWTKLGWVVHGTDGVSPDEAAAYTFHVRHDDDELCQLVKESFCTESFGVKVVQNLPKSADEINALKQIEKKTHRIGERFETGLLWKNEDIRLPPSKANAMHRLKTMYRKMNRDPEFSRQYSEKVNYYITKGYARKLSQEEASVVGPRTWYLPHFSVVKPSKPGKIRLVFDAAAKTYGVSLNDALLTGPDLLTSLAGVLLRFRTGQIGFSGDIKEMFHQVQIWKEDQCSQRFLWNEKDQRQEPNTYEMVVMTFGATCSPSLAQVVKNRNAEEFEKEYPEACRAIIRNHYVDDYLDGANTEAEAIQKMKDVREVHKRGGFEIRNWNCSSWRALSEICKDNLEGQDQGLNLNLESELQTEKVLGLHWNPNKDEFYFLCRFYTVSDGIVRGEQRPTKREVLKTFMSIFDPLGLIVHYTVEAKFLFQEIWTSGIGWDDELTDVQFVKWKAWLYEMKNVCEMKVPRCYSRLLLTATSIQLHIFCDASGEGFAAVGYLRIESESDVQTPFVMAKARVAPIKPMSIPRLELQAAVMGSRLAVTLREELDMKIDTVHFWSNSKTVLCWLRSDARQYKPFVACRVGEILESTEPENWHWVPTKENVADDATRSGRTSNFASESRWLNGPPFLKFPQAEWPKEKSNNALTDDETEVEHCFIQLEENLSVLPDSGILNSWTKLVRSTGWMIRFIYNYLGRKHGKKRTGELRVSELKAAGYIVLGQCQRESFQEEISSLKKIGRVPPTSKIIDLNPKLDKYGLLRACGRIKHCPELNAEARYLIFMDPKNTCTRLLVMRYHRVTGHGQEFVLNELRQKFWITNARTAGKRRIREYLPSLTKRKKWHQPVTPVKVDDLVFIADGDLPRNCWPRGKVTEVFPGRDGVVRTAIVRTATGNFRRPIVKLCVLDVEPEEELPCLGRGQKGLKTDRPGVLPLGGVCATELNPAHDKETLPNKEQGKNREGECGLSL